MRATTDTTRWARWKATLMGEESLGVNSSEPGINVRKSVVQSGAG
jgi:hypothetical protein